ncbi:Multidrug and toxin extrusion protein 1 [Lamellibrachia satsuma]|nr:Multidrug and toxin extrusion protein 1 [Lamellibrachia satsuma]
MQCFAGWGYFAKLAFLGLLMVCFEWWAFEVTVVMAGILGNTDLGAQTIMLNLNTFPLAIAIGIGNSTSVRVGQALGAGNPKSAKTAARVGITISTCVSLIMLILYATLRFQLPTIFTTDIDVIQLTASLLPIAAFNAVCNYQIESFRGILRGCGKQSVGTIVAFISYNIIALPIGIPLMFLTPLRIMGAWIGLCIALVFSASVYYVYVMILADWEDLSRQAQVLAGEDPTNTSRTNENPETETTPLLRSPDYRHDKPTRRSSRLTQSYSFEASVADAASLADAASVAAADYKVTGRTVILRLAIIAGFFGILAAGILSRHFAPRPSPNKGWAHINQTVPSSNGSASLSTFREPHLNLYGLY